MPIKYTQHDDAFVVIEVGHNLEGVLILFVRVVRIKAALANVVVPQ